MNRAVAKIITKDQTNPKDLVGRLKVDLSLLPAAGIIHGAHAFMDGAFKYGPYNWRSKKVRAMIYLSAVLRHILDFVDGEDVAEDSGAHHLGHSIACCAIILDAMETGNLIDDRPVKGQARQILDRLNKQIKERLELELKKDKRGVYRLPKPRRSKSAGKRLARYKRSVFPNKTRRRA